MQRLHFLFTTCASLTFATSAFAQVVPEIEPNTTKAEATPVLGIAAGGSITGVSTGAIATAGSTIDTTVDTFRVKTAALPPGVYEHRLTLTSTTAGATGTIRSRTHAGTACAGGTASAGDGAAQTAVSSVNQWYGFGNQEELYYRVTGVAGSTAQYAAVMTTTTITPTVIAPAFDSNSPITISTVGLTTVDTEIVLYDAAGNLVGQNDNACPAAGSQSRLTRTLVPGTYYVGVTTFELCVSDPAPVDDSFFGVIIDFPSCVVLSWTTGSPDWDFEVRGCNGTFSQVNQGGVLPFTVPWYQITVAPGAPPISSPANNACASATILTAPTTGLTANISTATNDGAATCDPGGAASKDVWYSFTNTLSGASQLKVDTCGSTTDTVVTIFNGCGGSEVVCSDDCGGAPCGGPGSCVTTVLAASQNVLIRVSDKGLGGCEFRLNLTNILVPPPPPPNDECTASVAISGFGNFPINSLGATTSGNGQTESLCNFIGIPATALAQDVWYTWTATANGTVELTTCGGIAGGPSPDSKIAVYPGSGCPTAGTAIACNEDSVTTCATHPFNARVFFTAVCGQEYIFQMGMYPSTTLTMAGTFSVTLTTPGGSCDSPTTAFCLGDGTGTPCPCTPTPNNGAPGHGCGSAAFPGGAILTTTGIASDESTSGPSADSFVLTATDVPGPTLFIQSNSLAATPIPFGDGQLCAAFGIIRLGVVFPGPPTYPVGVASYPGGTTPNEIHLQGLAVAGQTKHYQAWYRSVPGVCNPGSNFDLTQGLSVVWGP